MSLKQDLDTINTAVQKLLYDCNEVIGQYLSPVDVLAELPSRIEDVHNVGYTAGNDDGFAMGQQIGWDSGVEKGKQEAYDAFWDAYQENGTRGNYNRAFAGTGWDDTSFTPKYDIVPIDGTSLMFSQCRITNLKEALERCGVVLDFSKATSMAQIFDNCTITDVGVMDMRSAKTCHLAFMSATNLKNVEKLIFKDDGSQKLTPTQTFFACYALENIVVEGCIGYSFSLQWSSKLSQASIESFVVALSDTVTGQTATFSKEAVDAAFETSEGAADGSTSDAWTALVASKSNWTFTLA